MIAEMDGVVIRDFRVFWMGHRGDIEHTYTLNKRFPEDVIEKMRSAYRKALERYLITLNRGNNMDAVKSQMNIQFLLVGGLTMEEIEAMELDTANLATQDIDWLIKEEKRKQRLRANKKSQKLVSTNDVEKRLTEGWEFVSPLPKNKAVIGLRKREV
jgi:hypothetical protein